MKTSIQEGQAQQALDTLKHGVDQLGGLARLLQILALVRPVADTPAGLVQAAAAITAQLIRRGQNEKALSFYFETTGKTGLDLLLDLQAALLQTAVEKLEMRSKAKEQAHDPPA